MKSHILAHDLGTTGNKATLYDAEGNLTHSTFSGYETTYAHPGWAEQNPEDWWQAVCQSSRDLLKASGVAPADIACVTFSGQMMGCVPVDANAKPLRDAIIWADTRATAQADRVGQAISFEQIYKITGHRLSASYSLAKILWLKDHQPEIYNRTHKFLHAKDAMIARLTGHFATEPSDASGMNLYDLNTGSWSDDIISAADIAGGKLPEILPSTGIAGEITPEAAAETGLLAGTPVVMGGGDGSCASVGAGVVADGSAYNYIGSSAWIGIAASQPVYDPNYGTFTFAHVVPGMFSPIGTMQAAGASYQWVRDQFYEPDDRGGDIYEEMNQLAAGSEPGAKGLLYLPYLMGERSPRWNPNAKGAFVGLTIRHTKGDMIRAALEGITLNLRIILDAFRGQGADISAMRVIGGGAQSVLWNQMMADIYHLPVQRLAILEEATSMGAAVVGGVGVGLYPDFSIANRMNQMVNEIKPNRETVARYDEVYPLFEEAYQRLEPLFERL